MDDTAVYLSTYVMRYACAQLALLETRSSNKSCAWIPLSPSTSAAATLTQSTEDDTVDDWGEDFMDVIVLSPKTRRPGYGWRRGPIAFEEEDEENDYDEEDDDLESEEDMESDDSRMATCDESVRGRVMNSWEAERRGRGREAVVVVRLIAAPSFG